MTTPGYEHLEDFTAHEWCNNLLRDPTVTYISKRHVPTAHKGGSNTFFKQTLFTDDAIRAYLTLIRAGKGHVREFNPNIIFNGGIFKVGMPPTVNKEAELQRQVIKADLRYDHTDSDTAEVIVLVSIGGGVDGGIGLLHGGITASLLDQAMGTLLFYLYGHVGATSELNVKYKKAIASPRILKVSAKVLREKGRWIETISTIEDGHGTVFAEGRGAFVAAKVGAMKM